jgi:cytolysin-activating lysine-acyltransferase
VSSEISPNQSDAGFGAALQRVQSVKVSVQAAFGQAVLALSSVPRYRHQALSDLSHLVVDPLAHDCIAIVAPIEQAVIDVPTIVIWASVSAGVEGKLQEQIEAGVFPVRLKAEEWKSGDSVWLLDVISPSRKGATLALAQFKKIANAERFKSHPIIAHLVEKEAALLLRG